jgi:hypothetical protein
MTDAPAASAAPSVTEISNAPRRPAYRPLQPGELRRLARTTKLSIGLLGLQWAALAKRAVFGRRPR